MIFNIFICIAAIILFFRGVSFLIKSNLIWQIYAQIMRDNRIKVYGRVVDIEVKTKNDGDDDVIMMNCPIVEYQSDKEKKMNRQLVVYDIVIEMRDKSNVFYPQKKLHVGDKVNVMLNPNNSNMVFACPSMPVTRLLCRLFVPGCIYILAAVLGVCYVFIK